MAIIINNTDVVKENAEGIRNDVQNLKSVKTSISYILNELNEYWSATQEDQQAFYNELQTDIENLNTILTCDNEFAEAMIDYMEVTNKTSQTTV